MDAYQSVRNHLEFLGYTLDDKTLPHQTKEIDSRKHFLARISGNRTSFFVTYNANAGFSFVASYITKPSALNYKLNFLELLNKMSLESYLTSFVASKDLKTVLLLAWFPDFYTKSSFASFLEKVENDIKFATSNNREILNFIE